MGLGKGSHKRVKDNMARFFSNVTGHGKDRKIKGVRDTIVGQFFSNVKGLGKGSHKRVRDNRESFFSNVTGGHGKGSTTATTTTTTTTTTTAAERLSSKRLV